MIDRSTWETPALFRTLVDGGRIADAESYRAFNMGIGMVCFVDADRADEIQQDLVSREEPCHRIGEVREGTGTVRWSDERSS